jgi:hypothetical protein
LMARVLWLDSAGTTRAIKLRDGTTDATVVADSGGGGALFSGGALAWRGDGSGGTVIVEYRNGTLATLGPAGSISVEGDWAAWTAGSEGPVLRRDLAAGTTEPISATWSGRVTTSVDVGPGGEVAYEHFWYEHGNLGYQHLYLYRNGTTTYIPINNYGWSVGGPTTDGVNVLYHTISWVDTRHLLWIYGSGGSRVLSTEPYNGNNLHPIAAQAGGWVAYTRSVSLGGRIDTSLQLLSPAGTEEEASPPLNWVELLAVAPDGTLVFSTATQLFLKAPGGEPLDVGPTFPWSDRVIWRGGRFYLLTGGTVYELSS